MQVTLTRYVELSNGCRDYTVIDSIERAEIIKQHPDYADTCIIENGTEAVSADGTALPMLKPGLFRLWYRKDWDVSQNRRRNLEAKMEEARQQWHNKLQQVVAIFTRQGINNELATTMVQSFNRDTVESMLALEAAKLATNI